MSKRERPVDQTALPLLQRIRKGDFSRAEVAAKLKLASPQIVTNWLARGVPSKRMADVATLCGLTFDEYRREAGFAVAPTPARAVAGAGKVASQFEQLPPVLQKYIADKIGRLLRDVKAFPPGVTLGTPPSDPEQYRQWESEVEGIVLHLARFKDERRRATAKA